MADERILEMLLRSQQQQRRPNIATAMALGMQGKPLPQQQGGGSDLITKLMIADMERKNRQEEALNLERQKQQIRSESPLAQAQLADIQARTESRRKSAEIASQKQKEKQVRDAELNKKMTDFVKSSAQDTLNTLQKVKEGKEYFGLFGNVPPIPGTKMYTWRSNIDKLLSQRVVDLMNTMKQASRTGATGFGQLSEKELRVLQNASTALKRGLAPDEAMTLVNEMEAIAQKVLNGGQSTPQGLTAPGSQKGGITSTGMKYTIEE